MPLKGVAATVVVFLSLCSPREICVLDGITKMLLNKCPSTAPLSKFRRKKRAKRACQPSLFFLGPYNFSTSPSVLFIFFAFFGQILMSSNCQAHAFKRKVKIFRRSEDSRPIVEIHMAATANEKRNKWVEYSSEAPRRFAPDNKRESRCVIAS